MEEINKKFPGYEIPKDMVVHHAEILPNGKVKMQVILRAVNKWSHTGPVAELKAMGGTRSCLVNFWEIW